MAVGVSNAFVQLFDAEVKQAYQAQRALAGVVRERTNVEGSQVKFPKIGKGTATIRVPQTDVTPLNVSYSQVTATMSDYIAAEYSDIFSQQKINFDERRELVQVVSGAIGRRMDQLVIDALSGSGTALTVATGIGGATTNMNLAKLLAAKELLDTGNVPAQDRCMLIHASGLAALLDDTKIASSDYAAVKALVQGQIDTFLGFKFITIGDRDEGGLPKPSTRTCFAFHKDAIGMGIGMNQKTEINYVAEKTSFLVASMFSAGAVAIDAEGIVAISATE
jgi:N4-gp56 family major capsid protein